jgi:hypothetical protein
LGEILADLYDNIKWNYKASDSEDVDWIQLAQYREEWRVLLGIAMNVGFVIYLWGCSVTIPTTIAAIYLTILLALDDRE